LINLKYCVHLALRSY